VSAVAELTIFPLDKGVSLSAHVARVLAVIRRSGLPHALGPMGTCIEGEWDQVMAVVTACFEELRKDSARINVSLRVDWRSGPGGRLEAKPASVLDKLDGPHGPHAPGKAGGGA
jgi:uncharacterized protein (TIGR00106 family)